MRRRGVVLVAAIVSALAACSSSGDADPAPTTDPSTTIAVSEPEATTTAVPATTGAPTTTLDPATTLAAEVEADLLETFRLTDEAFLDPTNDEAIAAALDGYVGSNQDLIEARLEDFRANGYVTRPNPEVEARVIVEKPAVLASSPADTAVIQVCEVDSWIVVEPGAGPGGADAIVDPDVTSYRSNYVLLLVDGRWRIRGGETLGEWGGEVPCPPE